jgi:hypothetical protein
MDVFERQEAWQKKCQETNRRDLRERDARNFRVNLFLVLATIAAAVSSWWSATHPNVVVISQPPAVVTDTK